MVQATWLLVALLSTAVTASLDEGDGCEIYWGSNGLPVELVTGGASLWLFVAAQANGPNDYEGYWVPLACAHPPA